MPRLGTHLLNKQIFITRQSSVGTDKIAFSTITSAMSHIQPSTDSRRGIREGVFGKQFRIYVDGAVDVQAGDQIRDEDNNNYTVVADGSSRRQFGTFDYKLLLVEKTES